MISFSFAWFFQRFTLRHFDADFDIFNADIFGINPFEPNRIPFANKPKIIGGVQWVPVVMSRYLNRRNIKITSTGPATLSEFQ